MLDDFRHQVAELSSQFEMASVESAMDFLNGEYRPRIPQYPQIQDILGSAVAAVLAGGADPQAALDEAQKKARKLF